MHEAAPFTAARERALPTAVQQVMLPCSAPRPTAGCLLFVTLPPWANTTRHTDPNSNTRLQPSPAATHLVVQHVHEVCVEGVDVVHLGKVLQDLAEPLVPALLRVLDFAHVELPDALNRPACRYQGIGDTLRGVLMVQPCCSHPALQPTCGTSTQGARVDAGVMAACMQCMWIKKQVLGVVCSLPL